MLSDHPGHPTIWLVNGAVLFLFALAPTLALFLCAANDRICVGSAATSRQPPFVIALFALVTQFLGVGTLVAAGNALSTTTRYSMLVLPLALIGQRYVAASLRKIADRESAGPALAGCLAGLALGAVLFMRHAVRTEPITTPLLPGNVRTLPVSQLLDSGTSWAISLDLLLFYCVALAIFFSLHKLLRMASPRVLAVRPRTPWVGATLAGVLAFVLNFLGVVVLVGSANISSVEPRQAMVFFPLLLIVESYSRLMREEPKNRRSHLIGLVGSVCGMAAAVFLLMRDVRLH